MGVIGLLTDAATGGLLGLAGSVIGKVFHIIDRGQDLKKQAAEYQHELTLFDKQMELRKIEDENELAIKKADSANQMRIASYNMDFGNNGSSNITDLLRLVRPFLTILLVLITGLIWAFTRDRSIDEQIVETILFCTASALTWWFGDRLSESAKKKK